MDDEKLALELHDGRRLIFFDGTQENLLDHLHDSHCNQKGVIVASLNAYTSYLVCKMKDFPSNQILFTVDGKIPFWVFKILTKRNSPALIQGSSFGEFFLKEMRMKRRILVVGGSAHINQLAISKMEELGYFTIGNSLQFISSKFESQMHELRNQIDEYSIDTVFLCLGQPKQEIIATHLIQLFPAIQILCIGAFIDFFTNSKARAPKFIQFLGLEWLWRLIHEPKRLMSRYLILSPKGLIFLVKSILWR